MVGREKVWEKVIKRAGFLESMLTQVCTRINSQRVCEITRDVDGELVDPHELVCEEVADDGHHAARTKLLTQSDGACA